MDTLFQILFWFSLFALFHSYILFPIIINILGRKKQEHIVKYKLSDNNLPTISIILASHNEEKDIEKKIISTFKTSYPLNKIELLIGSDNSTDSTNYIIQKYSKKFDQIKIFEFKVRQGKIKIINQLSQHAKNQILILTDTKVFFRKNTIFNLIKYFKDKGFTWYLEYLGADFSIEKVKERIISGSPTL